MYRRWIAIVVLANLAGCSRRPSADQEKPEKVVYVKGNDPAMLAAITEAQATLSNFKMALAAPPPGAQKFSVKVGFSCDDYDGREHIWLSEPRLAEASVTGKINNPPIHAQHLELGQVVTAPLKDISDWMFIEGGVLRGGYTLRVMLDKMSPEGRKNMLAELGARLE